MQICNGEDNRDTQISRKTLQSLLVFIAVFAILVFSSSFSSISARSIFAAKENSNDDDGGDGGGDDTKTTSSTKGDDKSKSNDKDAKTKDKDKSEDDEKADTKTKITKTDSNKDTKTKDKDKSEDDEKADTTKTTTDTEKDSTDKTAIKTTTTLARCPNGSHRSPSGKCEKVIPLPSDLPRCPNGTHRSPSGDCEKVVPAPNPGQPPEGCINQKVMTAKENNDCVTKCDKGYQMKNGKCVVVPIKCPKGYVLRTDDNGKQYCKKLDGNGCDPYDKDGRVIKDNDCDGYSGYCPSDDTSFCWRSQEDFAKALAKNEQEHCGKVTEPFKGYIEVKYAHQKYPQLFKHVTDRCNNNEKINNNNKIDITTKNINKYTTKTNIITGPVLAQQRSNGSYQGTINDRFIEFTDMPANSTIIVPSPTTKTRNILNAGAIDVTGELKNIGVRQAKFISMVITVYNKFNQTLALENATPQPNSILPGQAAPFRFSIGVADGLANRTQDVASVKYHWTWFDENGNQH